MRGATAGAAAFAAALLAVAWGGPAAAQFSADASFPRPELPAVAEETQVLLEADTLTYDSRTETVTATGNATVYYGTYTVRADRIVYDRANDTVVAFGNIEITEEKGTFVQAGEIELTNELKEGFIYGVTAVLSNNARIGAARGIRTGGTITVFDRAVYTACEPCEEDPTRPLTWQLKADTVTHNETEQLISYENVTLELFGVPVFFLPYFEHPDPSVKRKSGFLTPSFAVSDFYGFGLRAPYFYEIAPNFDVTFTPLITTKQGPLLDFDFRYRSSNYGAFNIRPTFIWQADPPATAPGNEVFRGSLSTAGQYYINNDWSYGWDITAVTDDTYLQKYGLGDTTDLKSEIFLTGISERNYFSARGYHFDGLLASDIDATAPRVHPVIDHNYIFDDRPWNGELGLDTQVVSLSRDVGTDSTRLSSDLHWQRSFIGAEGYVIKPFTSLRADVYNVDQLADPTVPGGVRGSESFGRVLPSAGITASLPLARTDAWGTHVFEPITQFVIRAGETHAGDIPNEDALSVNYEVSNLFEADKFSGIDRYQSGTRADVGARYTLSDMYGGTLSAAAGQSFHIAGRNPFAPTSGLDTDSSDYVTSLSYQNEGVRLGWRTRLDDGDLAAEVNEVSLGVRANDLTLRGAYTNVAASANQVSAVPLEEIEGGASYKVFENWSVHGGGIYDIASDAVIKDYIGLGYDDECFAFRVTFSESFFNDRDIDPEQSVMLTFTLKSIGSTSFSQAIGSGGV